MDVALFSPSSLFGSEDEDNDNSFVSAERRGEKDRRSPQQTYLERSHAFPGGTDICIREYSFHQLNANLLWPGSFAFGEWLLQYRSCLEGQRILELGSGTGALAIFLRKSLGVDISTSDFDDEEIEENIAHNCRANALDALPHIRHTWGEPFPVAYPDWSVIIASDILLYVNQYPNLIKSLCFLLKSYKPSDGMIGKDSYQVGKPIGVSGKDVQFKRPIFLMSWRRRIGKEDEALFFRGCEDSGLVVEHLGSRVYYIVPRKDD